MGIMLKIIIFAVCIAALAAVWGFLSCMNGNSGTGCSNCGGDCANCANGKDKKE